MRKNELAIQYYQKVLDINPKNQYAQFNIANSYNLMQKYREAIVQFQKLLKINPKSEVAYTGIGLAYNSMQKYSNAIEAFKEVVKINPHNANAYYSIGLAYAMLLKYTKALKYYQKSIDINPNNENVYFSLGMTYYYTFYQYGKAEELFRKVISINRNYFIAYHAIFEIELITNRDFDKQLEKLYIEKFQTNRWVFIYYDMLKVLSRISKGQDVNISLWKSKYNYIPINWNFGLEDLWVSNMKDSPTKTKLLEALEELKK